MRKDKRKTNSGYVSVNIKVNPRTDEVWKLFAAKKRTTVTECIRRAMEAYMRPPAPVTGPGEEAWGE